jgi:phosphatidate phosphatase PAH1
VAQLYTSINTNGYKFLYLSARAIGQSKVTKDLLKSIKQEVHVLPEGPLLLSPTSLVSALCGLNDLDSGAILLYKYINSYRYIL